MHTCASADEARRVVAGGVDIVVRLLDQGRRIAPEQRDHRHAFGETDGEAFLLRAHEIEIDAERAARQRLGGAHFISDRVVVGAAQHQHAESAGIADGGDEFRADGATHRGLDDRHIDSKPLA